MFRPAQLLLVVLLLSALDAAAGQWARTIGLPGPDGACALVAVPDGSTLVVGSLTPTLTGTNRASIQRIDAEGEPVEGFGFAVRGLSTQVNAVARGAGGELLVAGVVLEMSPFNARFMAARVQPDGSRDWSFVADENGWDEARAIILLDDGSVLIGGGSDHFSDLAGDRDGAWLMRLRPDGSAGPAWQSVVTDPSGGLAQVETLVRAADGSVLVGGLITVDADDTRAPWWGRIDPADGRFLESHVVGDGSYGRIHDLVELPDGDLVVVGGLIEVGRLSSPWAARVDSSGALEWQVAFGDGRQAYDESLTDVEPAPGGGVVVAGHAMTDGPSGHWDILLATIDDAGGVSRTRLAGGALSDANPRLLPLADGWMLSGNTTSSGAGENDQWLLRLDENLELGPGDCGLIRDAAVPVRTTSLPSATLTPVVRATTVPGDAMTLDDDVLAPSVLEQCRFSRSLPGEVSPPGSSEPLRFRSRVLMEWEDGATGAGDTYLVYRGALPELRGGGAGSCLASGLLVHSYADLDPALPGGSFYLVGARNAAGDGSLGTDSLGRPRVPDLRCP